MEDGNQSAAAAAARVYEAVVSGKTAPELRAIIEECALANGSTAYKKGIALRRLAAVNTAVSPTLLQQQQQQQQGQAEEQQQEGAPRQTEELPLEAARRLRHGNLVCVLVEAGAVVEPVFGAGATAIGVCIACGEDAVAATSVRALLQAGADARAPIGLGRRDYSSRIVGFEQGAHTCTAAHLCVVPFREPSAAAAAAPSAPRLRCLEALVRHAPDLINALDSDGLAPLAWLGDAGWMNPAHQAWQSWLDPLLALGADPNRCGRGDCAAPPALHWIRDVSAHSRSVIVDRLRALAAAGGRFAGAVYDGQGDTALILAARWGLEQAVSYLLEELRADVHLPNRATGALPLTSCALGGPVVAALLAAGGDPNRTDRLGRRPLLRALSRLDEDDDGIEYPHGQACTALMLLRAGATVEGVRGPRGEPPLILACEFWPPYYLSDDRVRLLEELLRRTPDSDRRFKREDGRSAVDLICGVQGEWLDEDASLDALDFEEGEIDPLPDPEDSDEEADPGETDPAWLSATLQRTIAAHRRMVAELVISGASVLEKNQDAVNGVIASGGLQIAARRAARATRELAARRSEARRWRAHDCVVELALEERDVREADARLAATRARLEALERAVTEAEGEEVSVNGGGGGGGGGTEEEVLDDAGWGKDE